MFDVIEEISEPTILRIHREDDDAANDCVVCVEMITTIIRPATVTRGPCRWAAVEAGHVQGTSRRWINFAPIGHETGGSIPDLVATVKVRLEGYGVVVLEDSDGGSHV